MYLVGVHRQFVCCQPGPNTTEPSRLAIDDEFRRRKLRVHEITEVSTLEAFLGMEVDGKQGVLRPLQARVWKLYQAVSFLFDNPFLTSRSLSVILGHDTFLWCIDRKLLTTPHACYQLISNGFKTPKTLWEFVLRVSP